MLNILSFQMSFFRTKKQPRMNAYMMENDASPADDVPLLAFEATAPPQYTSHEVLVNEVTTSVSVPKQEPGVSAAVKAQDVNITVHNTLTTLSFSGTPFEDIKQFFREWKAFIGTTKLDEKQHLDKLGASLKSTAKKFYWAKRTQNPKITFDEMEKYLIDNFKPERPGMVYRKAAESRVQLPGELVSDYAWDKYTLIQKIDPPPGDQESIEMVMRGLRSSPLISSLYGEEFSDFMAFYSKLKLKAEGMAFAQAGSEATVLLADGEIKTDMKKWIPQLSERGERALQRQGKSRRQMAWNEKGEPRCFNCNEFGHMARECKKEKVRKQENFSRGQDK